ncbi:MAG: TetR/AcrR family transcriptional regulator [Bacteroidetes bacterium]|nr:MAG: TetR/AcrR family transcriptional regulator [Bacteroidota bacterium]TAG87619.1 MAG: TetR/AcrR family transcriptional regulator [Bacteroidota bacterium]
MIDSKEIWIETGYITFAHTGKDGLKIEKLAKKVGISKSSFYHHFVDIEIFVDYLLKHHIKQSYIIADKEQNAKNIEPELINILVEHKIDLLFNRQLRVSREVKAYSDILTLSNQIVGNAFVMLWVKELKPSMTQKQLEGIFELAIDNFYLQITKENLNVEWLSQYFGKIKQIIISFK